MLEIQELSYQQIRNIMSRVKPEINATEFHDLFLESLDRELIDLVGPMVREAIYGYVDRNAGFSRRDIPEHMDEFWILLDGAIGMAIRVVQKRVLERFYKELRRKGAETVSTGDESVAKTCSECEIPPS